MKKEKKIKENKLILISLFFLVLCVNAFPDAASTSLQDALDLEKEGKLAQASLLYQEWFKLNTTHPDFFQVLLHFSEIEENPFTILSVYEQYCGSIKDNRHKHGLEQRIALLYELLGDFDQALVYYRSAYSDVSMWENNSALLDPAKLLLAQGRYDQAQDWIFTVKPALKDDEVYAEAVFLMTRIYIISQQKEKAVQLLLKLKSKFRNSQMIPKCLLELMELYLEKGDTKDAEAAFTELDTQYGRTPEHELARNLQQPEADYSPLIDFYPLPYRFLGNTQPEIEIHADVSPQNEKQPASVSSTQGENPYHVCVGSFRVFENARQRQDELKSKGINSQISQKLIKNQTYYRVSVENSYNYEQAQHMIDTLKGLGYGESFIVKE